MRLIDADKLKEYFKEYTTHSGIQVSLDRYALKVIEEEPTVDAVPVIRCRECRYFKWNDCYAEIKREDGKKYYTSYIDSPNEDDYCSRAERR